MTAPTSNLFRWKTHGAQCLNSNCPELGYSVDAGGLILNHVHPGTLYTKFLSIDQERDKAFFQAVWREKFANSGTCQNNHSGNPKESEAGLVDLCFCKKIEIPAEHLNVRDIHQKIYIGIMPHISKWAEFRRSSACVYCLDAPLQFKISDCFPPQGSYTPSSSMSGVNGDHN